MGGNPMCPEYLKLGLYKNAVLKSPMPYTVELADNRSSDTIINLFQRIFGLFSKVKLDQRQINQPALAPIQEASDKDLHVLELLFPEMILPETLDMPIAERVYGT